MADSKSVSNEESRRDPVDSAAKALEIIQTLKGLDRHLSWSILQHVRPVVEPLGESEQSHVDQANSNEYLQSLKELQPEEQLRQLVVNLPLLKPSSRDVSAVYVQMTADAVTSLQTGSGTLSEEMANLAKLLITHMRQHGGFHSALGQLSSLEKQLSNKPRTDTKEKSPGAKGGKKKRVPLTPQRAAPLPPNAVSAKDEKRFSGEGFQKVKSWLKALRLHKYCHIFEGLGYDKMVNLTEPELEALGITAKGARSKMLKSIESLKKKNDTALTTLTQLDHEALVPSRLVDVLKELLEILEIPSPSEDERTAAQVMNLVSKAFTTYVAVQAQGSSQSLDVVQKLVAVLDAAMKHEIFSIEQKNVLFSTKSACNQLVQTLSAPSLEDRWSVHDPTQVRIDHPTMQASSRIQQAPPVPHVPYNPTGQMLRARQQRSYSMRDNNNAVPQPTERARGFSMGNEVQPIGTIGYAGPHHRSDPSIHTQMHHSPHGAWANPAPAIPQGDITHKAPGHERKMSGRSAPPGFFSDYPGSYSMHSSPQRMDDGEILALRMTEHALQDSTSTKPDQYSPH